MILADYIKKYFTNKADFGRYQGVTPQQVNKWLNMDVVVIDGKLYSYRRDIKQRGQRWGNDIT